jgi:hypothetical protein
MQDGIIDDIAMRPYFEQAEKAPPIRIPTAALLASNIRIASFDARQHQKVL